MSVVSKNPFDLLGDDGESSPAPAPAKAAPKKTEAPAPAKAVPGSAQPKDTAGSGRRGRGGYPGRGGPRNVYREENGARQAGDATAEGFETPAGFDGERIPNPRKGAHVRDAHTKGPRGNRPARNYTSGGHTPSGTGSTRGPRTPASGGERRQFERRSGTLPDSQKKVEAGWGADEGNAELTAEVEGLKDAVAEENAETPAAEAEGETAAAEPEEPEEVQKSLDEYLAERASNALALGKKEARQVNSDSVEGKAFVREAIDEFFSGKEKTTAAKTKAPKKEKVFIEVDGTFASPANSRPPRPTGERGGRGGRGGFRGDARGARGGARGGRGSAPRGRAAGSSAPINANDESAFPALGA